MTQAETNCPICLETIRDAALLPACGHSFCHACISALPLSRRGLVGSREADCPICRARYTPGSSVPNWALRDAVAEAAAAAAAPPESHPRESEPETGPKSKLEPQPSGPQASPSEPAWAPPLSSHAVTKPASRSALARLGIPPGLCRIALDEARRVGLRVFLLDNSGSTGESTSGRVGVSCVRARASVGLGVGVRIRSHRATARSVRSARCV